MVPYQKHYGFQLYWRLNAGWEISARFHQRRPAFARKFRWNAKAVYLREGKMIIPNDARLELLATQEFCANAGIPYEDHIWQMRYPEPIKSTGSWPFRRARDVPSNVTPIRKRKP